MKIVHVRYYSQDNDEVLPTGGETIVYSYEHQDKKTVMKYAVARCCDVDNYCKKTGRELAIQRLQDNPLIMEFPSATFVPKESFVRYLINTSL